MYCTRNLISLSPFSPFVPPLLPLSLPPFSLSFPISLCLNNPSLIKWLLSLMEKTRLLLLKNWSGQNWKNPGIYCMLHFKTMLFSSWVSPFLLLFFYWTFFFSCFSGTKSKVLDAAEAKDRPVSVLKMKSYMIHRMQIPLNIYCQKVWFFLPIRINPLVKPSCLVDTKKNVLV